MSKQQQILDIFQKAISNRKVEYDIAAPCLDENYDDNTIQTDDHLEEMVGLNDDLDLDQERRRYQKRTWSNRVQCSSAYHYNSYTSDSNACCDSNSYSVSYGPQIEELCQEWCDTTLASINKSIDSSSTDIHDDGEVLYIVLAKKEAELRQKLQTTIKTERINTFVANLESQKYNSLFQSAIGARLTMRIHDTATKCKEARYCSITSWLDRML